MGRGDAAEVSVAQPVGDALEADQCAARPAPVLLAYGVPVADPVSRRDVVAFRLRAHNLADRVDSARLLAAACACGIQDSPPGSSLLAMNARVRNLKQEQVAGAVAGDKSLLRTWSMRGAPFHVPVTDAPVFTAGVLPPTGDAMRHFIPGVVPALDRLGMGLAEAVALAGAEVRAVLAGRKLAINELGSEVAERIARGLPDRQREAWAEQGPYAPGQPLGEGVVHFCIRILALQGVVCFAPRSGGTAPFVLVEEWLGHPIPDVDPAVARGELLRRYLHCYGPSTRGAFAAWVGINAGDTDAWWSLVADELTEIDFGGSAWILSADRDALGSAVTPQGVRLLPPHDPFTQVSDRDTIVDPVHHREVWRPVGDPGTVLVDGRIVGTWRQRMRDRRLAVAVTRFCSIPRSRRRQVERAAEAVARLRGACSVDVSFDG